MGLAATNGDFAHMFTPPPAFDWGSVIAEDLKDFERMVDRFEAEQAKWRTETAMKVRKGLEDLKAKAVDVPRADAYAMLEADLAEALSAIDDTIKSFAVPMLENPQLIDRLASISKTSPSAGRFLRKQLRRAERVRVQSHNALVDFYYSILAFFSEFEPDEEQGPTFSDPAELTNFIRSRLA
jgi:hypothetical protein